MKKIIHICPLDRNTGDNALNKAIRTMLGQAFAIEHLELVGTQFDRSVFDKLNAADAVVFGGGGVIHSCSGGNSRKNREHTGTMWNMDLDWIAELKSKIILYSVGFNRFQGEPPPLTRMGEFYDVLARKGALASFRNDLSRERFLDYFPRFGGVRVTPDPGLFCRGTLRKGGQSYALLQIACDRLEYRYPNGLDDFLSLLNAMREISPVPIFLIPHTTADRRIYGRLTADLKVDNILGDVTRYADVDDAMDLYRNALYTISTRGHSQICSVGNGTPTFAMSTHPKARGFMEEIGQLDACFDYLNSDRDQCLEQFRKFIARLPKIRDQLIDSNRKFDSDIDAFNHDIYRYVYEDWTPPPLMTDPDAVPRLEAVRLEDEIANHDQEARQPVLASAAAVRADTKNAYLPGRRQKVGVGTYVKDEPVVALKPLSAPPAAKLASSLLWRTQRSLDGATCGVVISCDANYFVGVATCVAAIRRYNPQLPITFLDAGLRPDQVEHAKALVDTFAPIPELETLDVSTFPSHLSKAALSSLYCHLADYDKVLYIDVDALVLGDLSPMFEALDPQTDIVGVRGNYFNRLIEGRRHTTRSEVAESGVAQLAAAFPSLDLDAPGINSGCFVVWARTSQNWQDTYHQLLPFMESFRTADQALLNALISIDGLALKLFDPMYNCMGFQLTKVRHQVQELTTGIEIDPEHCSLTLAGKRVVVAHFAGRRKPWDTSLNLAPSFAWDWHAATTDAERKWIVAKHRVCRETSEKAILAAAVAEMAVSDDPFQFCLDMGDFLRQEGQVAVASRLFEMASEKRKKSFGALKNQILLGPQMGNFAPSVDKYLKDKKCSDNRDRRLKSFAAVEIPALDGRFSADAATNSPPEIAHLRVREFARINKPNLMEAVIASLSLQRQLNPEMVLLRSFANTSDLQASAMETMGYFARSDKLHRRASNAAMRAATARLAALNDLGRTLKDLPTGPIGQMGAGFGHFLRGLTHILGRPGVSIDLGAPACPELAGLPTMPFEDCGTDLSFLVVANVMDRANDPRSVIAGFGALLQRDGYLLVIDPVNNATGLDLFEGLGFIVPSSRLAKASLIVSNTNFVLERSWLINGERMLLLRKLSGRRPAGSKAKLDEAVLTAREVLRAAATSISEASDATAQAVRERLARIVFQADTILGDPLPVDRRRKRILQNVPVLPAPKAEAATANIASEIKRDENYVHVAYWSSQNAGDRVLCEQTAELFAEAFPKRTSSRINVAASEPYEKHVDGHPPAFVLLGGGGIFHSTSSDNGVCEWNISRDVLETLDSPIIAFGVGMNEFRGADLYGTGTFRDYMGTMLKKSLFFGLREKQSVTMLRRLFPEYSNRIFYQPCASLLLRFRYPVLQLNRTLARTQASHVALVPAFDRSNLRFGNRMDLALKQLDGLVTTLLSKGHRVSIAAHCPEDAYLHAVLARKQEVGLLNLAGLDTKEVIHHYADVDLAISMRTHGLLVPFAMGIPTMAIETHDKLIRSNDDLGILSWGVDIFDTEFAAKSSRIATELLENSLAAKSLVKSRLNGVFQTTHANLAEIKARIQGAA